MSGNSGSPILTQTNKGKWVVIGIHTHKGMYTGVNSGIYFNEELLGLIHLYADGLKKEFELNEDISYVSLEDDRVEVNEVD